MVALVWRTRAAPVLHVNTFSKTVYDVLVGSNKSQGGVRRFLRWSGNDTRGMRGSRPQVIVFRMLSFAEAVGREVGPTGQSMTRWRDRKWAKSFLEPTGFAAYRALRRWTTPRSTPRDALSACISGENMARLMSSSAWTLANPVRTSPPCSPRASGRLGRRCLSPG